MDLTEPRKTPLYDRHAALGARIVDFAGWWLPVQYAGILEEHRAVREAAGMFDVSHMGEIRVTGPDSFAFLQKVLTNTLSGMKDGGGALFPHVLPIRGNSRRYPGLSAGRGRILARGKRIEQRQGFHMDEGKFRRFYCLAGG